MVQYPRLFALAVAVPLLGGYVLLHSANSQTESCSIAPVEMSAPSVVRGGYRAEAPADHGLPLAAGNTQPADEALDPIELEPAQIQNQSEANNLAIQNGDRSLHPIGDHFDPSLVSQHVRLQI